MTKFRTLTNAELARLATIPMADGDDRMHIFYELSDRLRDGRAVLADPQSPGPEAANRQDPYDEGYNTGWDEGFDEGRDVGYDNGFEAGELSKEG